VRMIASDFSGLYKPLQDLLVASLSDIAAQMKARKSSSEVLPEICPWAKNDDLQGRLTVLKHWADVVSRSSTKLTIVVTKIPSEESIREILNEIHGQVGQLMMHYMMTVDYPLCYPLFSLISTLVRGELSHLADLLKVLAANEQGNIRNTATGMVWKINDKIQQIPLANKAAYRRHLLEKISVAKDTLSEFEGYLTSSKEEKSGDSRGDGDEEDNEANGDKGKDGDIGGDEGEGEEDEEDDDDFGADDFADDAEQYGIDAIPVVEKSLKLMNFALESLKAGLNIMTLVADARSSSAVKGTEAAGKAAEDTGTAFNCDRWVAEISARADEVESHLTDFGAELYPPLDVEALPGLRENGDKLKATLGAFTELLLSRAHFGGEAAQLPANDLKALWQQIMIETEGL
jgi:Grap2 and cyclin-D-interacting